MNCYKKKRKTLFKNEVEKNKKKIEVNFPFYISKKKENIFFIWWGKSKWVDWYNTRIVNYFFKKVKNEVRGTIVLNGLIYDHYSQARSHYCPTRGLLSAAFPPWTESPLLGQPGQLELPLANHIDARLSADARSPKENADQGSHSQTVHPNKPPRSWITGIRQHSRRGYNEKY